MTTSSPTYEDGTSNPVITIHDPESKNKIVFTDEKLRELKTAYNQALADDKTQFVFDNLEFLTAYAKYMIEYIELRLNSSD